MSIRIDGTNTTANPGITGSDTDTGLQFGTNEVKVVTDGNDRVTVDSSGNIGVGVTPSSWGGSRNAIQFDSAGAAYICNDSTVGIVSNMYFDGSNNKYINAGTASSSYFQQDNVVFQFAPSGSADGNGTFTTSTRIDADGVKFGSDTAAANALDDYEEGTFTPTWKASGTNYTSVTYSIQTGLYTKIGNIVYISLRLQSSGYTGSPSGYLQVDDLPFNVNDSTGAGGGSPSFFNIDVLDSAVNVATETRENHNEIYLLASRDNGDWANVSHNGIQSSGTSELRVSFFYKTDS